MSAKGLGKGFDVLIPTDFDEAILTDVNDRVQKLFIDKIQPNPDQPRRSFDKEALDQLAVSIKRYGILQPVIVSPQKDGYVLVAGERRWRAAQIAGLENIPAIVRKRKELEKLEIALIENVQREDLSPLEQAVSIEKLHQQFNISYQDISNRLGKANSTINNIVRLLQLPEEARKALQDSKITEGHARSILALKDAPREQAELLKLIIKHGWNVRQAERFVTSIKQGARSASHASKATSSETPATKKLGKALQTKVTVRHMAKGGRLEIHYKSETELNALIERFQKL